METVYILGLTLAMTLATGFFIFEIPLKGGRKVVQQKLQDPKVKKRLAALAAACLALVLYGIWLFGPGQDHMSFLLGAGYLLAVTPSDITQRLIPDRASAAFGAAFVLFQLTSADPTQLADAVLGAVLGAVLLGLPYLILKESIGLGDVKMVAVCGVLFGAVGVIQLLLRAFVAIFAYSVIQLLRKKVTLKTETPFAPFLLFAAII